MSKYAMLIFVSGKDNNNKFYEVKLDDNGLITKRWGRVDSEGQSGQEQGNENSFDRIVRSKLSKGYEYVPVIENSKDSEIKQINESTLKETAVEDLTIGLKTDEQKKRIVDLIELLVKTNQHQISQNSGGKITIDEQGVVKTSLGLISVEGIQKARKLLVSLNKHLDKSIFDDAYTEILNNYLKLIPQAVPARKGWSSTFFTQVSTIDKQVDLLDQLETSLDLYEEKKKQAIENAKKDDNQKREKLFNCSIEVVDDENIFKEVEKFFNEGKSSSHDSSKLKLVRIYKVNHDGMRAGFEEKGEKIGNFKRLWHGTRMFNILSILKSGLFVPKSNAFNVTARMFGDGIYMSDKSTKSLNYSYGYWDSRSKDNHCFMFLMKAAMGNEYIVNSERGNSLPIKGYDSSFAKAGTSSGVINNEMIVYDKRQVDIEYLCEFKEK